MLQLFIRKCRKRQRTQKCNICNIYIIIYIFIYILYYISIYYKNKAMLQKCYKQVTNVTNDYLCPMNAMLQLKSKAFEMKRIKFPSMPTFAIVTPAYTDKTANGLTKCIIDWIELNGYQAERITSSGRYIDNKMTYTDVVGRQKTIGTGKWIPGSSTKGTSDISATIKGRSVKIEVKIGKDRQSEAQLAYQKKIEQSGGIYFIAKDFDSFMKFYVSLTA